MNSPKQPAEHAVTINIKLTGKSFEDESERVSIEVLEQKITRALENISFAELDGDEFGQGECSIFLYGQDADKLFEAIHPLLDTWNLFKGGSVTRRYGPPGANEIVTKY